MIRKTIFILFVPLIIFSLPSEKNFLQRIESHILIQDYSSALQEANIAIQKFPKSKNVRARYIETLALSYKDYEASTLLKSFIEEYGIESGSLIEEVCWGIINKAALSSQYQTRLTASIGAYLTHDIRAVLLLKEKLKDSNAVIRSIALQLASSYMDKPIKDEIIKLLENEKLWLVRLEVIKAVGNLKIKEKKSDLKEIIASDSSTYEEKEVATNALASITDNLEIKELLEISKSRKKGLRKLACDLIAYFDFNQASDVIQSLLDDPISEVRMAALNTVALVFLNVTELEKNILKLLDDPDPTISITAAYVAVLKNIKIGEKRLARYIYNDNIENQRFAAACLGNLINKCLDLKKEVLSKHKDPYVLVNIAMGLITERKFVEKSSDVIYNFLKNEKNKIMLDTRKNSLFQTLTQSYIRHVDQIPNYPEAVDQITRLNLLNMLAIVQDTRAQDAIKDFLTKKGLNITGFAATMLLKEGDSDALSLVKEVLNEKDEKTRVQAALVLGMIGKEAYVIDVLIEAYKNADHELKIRILEVLGSVSHKNSINFLIDALTEPYQILRVVAASSLIRSING